MNRFMNNGLTSDLSEVSWYSTRLPEVYSPTTLTVKKGVGFGILILCTLLTGMGCAPEPVQVQHQQTWTTGIRYSTECVRIIQDVDFQLRIRKDFETFQNLGFDTIMPVHVCQQDKPEVEAAIRSTDLHVIVSDSKVQRMLATNQKIPPGQISKSVAAEPTNRAIYYNLGFIKTHQAENAIRVIQEVKPDWIPLIQEYRDSYSILNPVQPNQGNDTIQFTPIALIPLSFDRLDPQQDHRKWLLRFHEALATGATGGIVFDSWQEAPGRYQSPGDADQLTPGQKTMLKKIIRRAKTWGNRLFNARVMDINESFNPIQTQHPNAVATLFQRNARMYLMIRNQSGSTYLRSRLFLQAAPFPTPLNRAVQIAGDDDAITGKVIRARQEQLEISLELSPGDAVLYELF